MNHNSMFYWWPLIKDLPIFKPKTLMVPFEGEYSTKIFDGEDDPVFDQYVKKLKIKARKIGYPLFMRADETSNKHEWNRSCYVISEDQIASHLLNILEMIEMQFTLGFRGVALREFLDLDSRFTAFNGMPVACERRLFVRDGKLECNHPYWPPASIRRPSIKDWQQILKELQTISFPEELLLERLGTRVGRKVGGYWSIDFCRHRNGRWFLTDMALGDDSYHWGTCPHAPKEMLEHYGDPEKVVEEKEFNMEDFEKFLEKGSGKEDG